MLLQTGMRLKCETISPPYWGRDRGVIADVVSRRKPNQLFVDVRVARGASEELYEKLCNTYTEEKVEAAINGIVNAMKETSALPLAGVAISSEPHSFNALQKRHGTQASKEAFHAEMQAEEPTLLDIGPEQEADPSTVDGTANRAKDRFCNLMEFWVAPWPMSIDR